MLNKSQVALKHCSSYCAEDMKICVEALFNLFGGIRKWVSPGKIVLLKPNMLSSSLPEEHITTHPEVVRSVAIAVIEAGGRVWIGDSQGIGNFHSAAESTGIKKVAGEVGAELKEFNEKIPVKCKSGYTINIAKPVLEADVVINLPKLKSHLQMYLTLGIKNCFGCVPGTEKGQWHFRAGISEIQFARLLVDVYGIVKPSLTIVDSVVAMEGNGPSSGAPRKLGCLMAAKDAVALDRIAVEMLGLDPKRLKTLRAAKERMAGETEIDNISIIGEPLDEFRVPDFKAPDRIQSLQFERIPKPFRSLAKNFLTSKPVLRKSNCNQCKKCEEICPTKSVVWQKGFPHFAYDRCIKCFCCQEACKNDAIAARPGMGLILFYPFRKFLNRRWGIDFS